MYLTVEFLNVLIMSVAFLLLFAAYNTIQNYVTSLLPGNLGNVSLGVLYVTVAVTVFLAPAIVYACREKWTMVFGALCYVVYMASLIEIVEWAVLGASVVIGFGAAILWVAQGSFLTLCSPKGKRGTHTGIFWGLFQFSNVFGNLAAYFVLPHVSKALLFAVFTSVGAAGAASLLFLRRIAAYDQQPAYLAAGSDDEEKARRQETIELVPPGKPIRGIVGMWRRVRDGAGLVYRSIWLDVVVLFPDPRILLLSPIFFFTGFELAFWTGEFPQLLDPSTIGLVLMFAGVAEVVGGLMVGWLSDRLGRSFTVLLGTFFYATGLLLTSYLKYGYWESPALFGAPLSAFAAAYCFGTGDSAFNTQTYAALGQLFPDPERKSLGAFTIFQFVQNVGSAVGFFYALALPLHGATGTLAQAWIQLGVLGLASVLFVAVDWIWLRRALPT